MRRASPGCLCRCWPAAPLLLPGGQQMALWPQIGLAGGAWPRGFRLGGVAPVAALHVLCPVGLQLQILSVFLDHVRLVALRASIALRLLR